MSESVALMEPMIPAESNDQLDDLVIDLVRESSLLAKQLNPTIQQSVGHLVRSMNCYYSNLIEGHNTLPGDIERALNEDYSSEPKKRDLQKEAIAHIEVQKQIDEGKGPEVYPATIEYALWLHKSFCELMPEELLWVKDPISEERIKVIPGQIRERDVHVGQHLAPHPENLSNFLKRFEEAYNPKNLSKSRRIIAVACAHHRFLWIHPFMDGNGRVARLMSYAMFMREEVGNTMWSVARGLAKKPVDYKSLLEAADNEKRNDYDGRGTLSETALVNFSKFFLETCIDQVRYMDSILNPVELDNRIKTYTQHKINLGQLPKGSYPLLREALLAGEFERGKASDLTGYKERQARSVVSTLLKEDLLVSDSPKGLLRLGFPIKAVEEWFPSLYPST